MRPAGGLCFLSFCECQAGPTCVWHDKPKTSTLASMGPQELVYAAPAPMHAQPPSLVQQLGQTWHAALPWADRRPLHHLWHVISCQRPLEAPSQALEGALPDRRAVAQLHQELPVGGGHSCGGSAVLHLVPHGPRSPPQRCPGALMCPLIQPPSPPGQPTLRWRGLQGCPELSTCRVDCHLACLTRQGR